MRLRGAIPRTFVLCAPFWSGSAHVMALGPVVVEQRTPQRDGGNSNPVRHRTDPLPDCEAIEKCRWLRVTGGWRRDSRDMAYLGMVLRAFLAISRQCFVGMRRLTNRRRITLVGIGFERL